MQHGSRSPDRSSRMLEMAKAGLTLQQIGDQFSVTRERVRQILNSLGIGISDRCRAVRQKHRKEASISRRLAQRDAKAMRLYGCDYSQELKGCLAKSFVDQLRNAEWRGIEFRLSFPVWVELWERSGHLHERGRGHGKYVMSRFGDKGAYEVGNVFIQLADENCREGILRTHARGAFKKKQQQQSAAMAA